jgi:hypothetical protein
VVSENVLGVSRPIDGAAVNAFVEEQGSGYSYWWAHGPTFSDPGGGFRLTDIRESSTVRLQVWKEGYAQQCASPPITMRSDTELNAELVSRGALPASPESIPPPAPGFRSLSGRILEADAAATSPVANAFVDFEPVMDFPAATTFSDAAGRYLLCGVPDDRTVDVCAGSPGRAACVSVPVGQSTGVDVVLPSGAGP